MNIYNSCYFAEAELAKGVSAIFQSLKVGGMWIVGRTEHEEGPIRNDVTILRRSDYGFQLLDRLNGGSELEVSLERWGYFRRSNERMVTA